MVLDDATLIAYLDGQLSDAECHRLEERLAHDSVAAGRLDQLARSADLARRAFEPVMQEPVPPDLIAAVWQAPLPASGAPSPRRRAANSGFWPRFGERLERMRWGWGGMAGAVAIAAVVAVLVLPYVPEPNASADGWALRTGDVVRGDALAVALDTAPSGRSITIGEGTAAVVATFETREGFCREVSRQTSDRAFSELAILCRGDQESWRVVFAEGGAKASYVTASSQRQDRADAVLEALGAVPLGDSAENELLAKAWRR